MDKCKKCNQNIRQGGVKGCKNCGAVFCEKCAENNHDICPNCYNSVEYIG